MSSRHAHEALGSLAIETTGRSGSVALLRGETLLTGYSLDDRTRSAASLAPRVKQALEDAEQQGWEVSFISVADGPGSFTGLRIAVTTAKMLAYARRLPLVSVDSVAAIAATAMSLQPAMEGVRVALDAYRGQAFIGDFRRESLLPELARLTPDWTAHPETVRIASGEELARFLTDRSEEIGFAGDRKLLQSVVPEERIQKLGATTAGGQLGVAAWGVGRLGLRARMLGREITPVALKPRYLRPSAAEEKADAGGELPHQHG